MIHLDNRHLSDSLNKITNGLQVSALALMLGIAGFGVASAQDAGLSSATSSKTHNLAALNEMVSSNPGGRHRVIIQYAAPEVDAPQGATEVEKDEILMQRNAAMQDAILTGVFGSADGVLSGPLSAQYNITRMDYSPHMVMELTTDEINQMSARSDVVIIQPDIPEPPIMDQSTAHVDMPPVWTAGGLGAGRTSVVIDTGIKKTHEFITSAKVVSEACYNTTSAGNASTSFCPGGDSSTAVGSGDDCSELTANGCSHGTHVAGTIAGSNTNRQGGEPLQGMAPSANLIAINVFSFFSAAQPLCGGSPCVLAYQGDQIDALNRVYALRNTYNIDSINMSLGGGQFFSACDTDPRKAIIDLLKAANIATIIAAGNDGFNTSVGAPGCISTAITVASSLDTSDSRSSFSNWGSLIDVVAPGSNIQSSIYGNTVGNISGYSNYNGTSMATPHVAGAFAALRQLYPTATVDQIEAALENTGVGITSASVTKPRIDMDAACANLGGGTCGVANTPVIFASVLPSARGTQTGNAVTAFASITNSHATEGATNCSIALPGGTSGTLSYQQTNASNVPIGTANTPVNIGANSTQGFVITFTPSTATSGHIALVFDCTNTDPVTTVFGLNTFLYGSVNNPTTIADIVAVAATLPGTSYIDIPGTTGQSVASVSALNIGATKSILVGVGEQAVGGVDPNMPATLQFCVANNMGVCTSAYATQHTVTATNGASLFFVILATGSGTVADNPATNRAHLYFYDTNVARYVGATSVAVRTVVP